MPDYIHGVTSAPDPSDGRPAAGAAIGVVPVCHDDRQAPGGCAALRELHGTTLLARSVAALQRCGVVGEIVVAVPPVLVLAVRDLLAVDTPPAPAAAAPAASGGGGSAAGGPALGAPVGPGAAVVRVSAVPENGPGYRVRAALRLVDPPADRPVVVHDPLYPLAPGSLVRAVLRALVDDDPRDGGCVVAVPVRPVTDTLKWVDQDDVVLGMADRALFRMVYSPQAYWPAGLASTLDAAGDEQLRADGAAVLPGLIQAAGGRLLPVPAPGEVFRISTEEDLILAEAMLHVGAGSDTDAAGN